MASEVTVRKLTQGFMVSTPRTMRDGVPVEEAYAASTRPEMIQRVLRCLGIEPHEAYFEYATTERKPVPRIGLDDPLQDDDEGEPFQIAGCANGACGVD